MENKTSDANKFSVVAATFTGLGFTIFLILLILVVMAAVVFFLYYRGEKTFREYLELLKPKILKDKIVVMVEEHLGLLDTEEERRRDVKRQSAKEAENSQPGG